MHQHSWTVTAYTLLSLPVDHLAERVVVWECATCPHYVAITGWMRLGIPLHTPPWWEAAAATSQRREERP